jgi:acetylornithine deacetylase/succinyl-diaminopimelate desuccinylase-like protein
LPGDDPDTATEEIRAVIGDLAPYQVTIRRDVFMLPALIDPDDAGIQALQEANRAIGGHKAKTYYEQGTFDAGGLVARGVPTVTYGASGGVGLMGVDFVPISAVETEARVLAHLILSQLV